MRQIVVINAPLGSFIDRDICARYGRDFFCGSENIDEQWRELERMRDDGGIIFVQPNRYSAIRELLDFYIGEDGVIKDVGYKMVNTREHGEFNVFLYSNSGLSDISRGWR